MRSTMGIRTPLTAVGTPRSNERSTNAGSSGQAAGDRVSAKIDSGGSCHESSGPDPEQRSAPEIDVGPVRPVGGRRHGEPACAAGTRPPPRARWRSRRRWQSRSASGRACGRRRSSSAGPPPCATAWACSIRAISTSFCAISGRPSSGRHGAVIVVRGVGLERGHHERARELLAEIEDVRPDRAARQRAVAHGFELASRARGPSSP